MESPRGETDEGPRDIDLDFTGVPFDVQGLYDLPGLPEYLAERAAADARADAPDPFTIDMWTLHPGANRTTSGGNPPGTVGRSAGISLPLR